MKKLTIINDSKATTFSIFHLKHDRHNLIAINVFFFKNILDILDENNKGIVGASIIMKNSEMGTLSKEDGSFILNLPEQLKSIVVSAKGFETQELTIGSKSIFDVKMIKSRNSNQKSQTQISGRVLDKGNREPLIGVNIVVKGTVLGTVTDLEGTFTLSIQSAPPILLAVSSIGYNGQEIEINDDYVEDLEIILEDSILDTKASTA